jgi:predicted  nucleic acid-binding Zn-ribbon protein
MRLPWAKVEKTDAKEQPLTVGERLTALESEHAQLRMEWDEVLDRLTRRAARQAALKRADLARSLDQSDASVDPGANGTVEAAELAPSKAQLWAMARRRA